MKLHVTEDGKHSAVENVESFETHSDGVIVEFADGTDAEFDSVWAGSEVSH